MIASCDRIKFVLFLKTNYNRNQRWFIYFQINNSMCKTSVKQFHLDKNWFFCMFTLKVCIVLNHLRLQWHKIYEKQNWELSLKTQNNFRVYVRLKCDGIHHSINQLSHSKLINLPDFSIIVEFDLNEVTGCREADCIF